MNKKLLVGLPTGLFMLGMGGIANAAIIFDQNVTSNVIFGSGNDNGAFTVDRNNGIELGLRGKLRHDAGGSAANIFNSNGDGTYSFNAGVAPTQSSPVAEWSFEWSINSNFDGSGSDLNAFSYALGVDQDPSAATNFNISDPINVAQADHAIGTNLTLAGAGTSANDPTAYASLIGNNNLAQNSWKAHWFIDTLDPTLDGAYDFYLTAFNGQGNVLAHTQMQIIVGTGAVPAPEPATMLLFGAGFAGLIGSRVRRKKKA